MRKKQRKINQASASFIFIVLVCILHLMAGAGIGADCEIAAGTDANAQEDPGPVIFLRYSKEPFKENPISSFLYFIPLISLTPIERQTSENNEQQAVMITCERERTSKSFFTTCEFEITGNGFHRDVYDPAEMIAYFKGEIREGQTLPHLLEYIQLEGPGFVRIEITGSVTGSVDTVTQVDVWFNGRGHKSPVTIGLYDVRPVQGEYRFENRSNQIVVRVNRLTFKRMEGVPTMGVRVATLGRSAEEEGLWATVKGAIANLLIRPPRIDPLGNDTMLNFGAAIQGQNPSFSLPKADKIKKDRPEMLSTRRAREHLVQQR